MSCANILDLNDDCLIEIARFLKGDVHNRYTWLSYASVCRRFMYIFCTAHKKELTDVNINILTKSLDFNTLKALIDDYGCYMQKVKFRDTNNLIKLEWQYFLQNCNNVQDLTMHFDLHGMPNTLQVWTNLRKLCCHNFKFSLRRGFFLNYINMQQNLKVLLIGDITLTSYSLRWISNLNITHLQSRFQLTAPIDFDFLPKLTHLDMTADAFSFEQLAMHKANQLIALRCRPYITFKTFMASFEEIQLFQNLQHLFFSGVTLKYEHFVIIAKLKQLSLFQLEYCNEHIFSTFLLPLIENCKYLRTICIAKLEELDVLDDFIDTSQHPHRLTINCSVKPSSHAVYKWLDLKFWSACAFRNFCDNISNSIL